MHDTHVHLEILLEKLENPQNIRQDCPKKTNENSSKLTREQKELLQNLLKNHDFAIHSTVSWSNFEQVFSLFSGFDQVKFLFGTHPEIVNEGFEIAKYLQNQQTFWQEYKKTVWQSEVLKNWQMDKTNQPKDYSKCLEILQNTQKLVGIGEIGLDYFYTQQKNLIQIQQKLFISQINFSLCISKEKQDIEKKLNQICQQFLKNTLEENSENFELEITSLKMLKPKLTVKTVEKIENYTPETESNLAPNQLSEFETVKNLPIVIHCRNAFDDLLAILRKISACHNNFLIHCFTGDVSDLRSILDLGGVVAFGGILTYKNAENLRIAAKFCPLSSLVLETDLPFLSPQSRRSQVCLPEFINETAQILAQIKDISIEEIWQKSLANSQKLFNL